MDIPLLQASDIEIRVQSVTKNQRGKVGAILLLYKDARVDMRILDKVFGATGWQRSHEIIGGNLYCNIDIWDSEKSQWVRKQDVGTESNTQKEKGQASDAFKRAGFNLGIGRELYTSPFIYVELTDGEHYDYQGKPKASASLKFSVKEIGYNDDREIISLTITDGKGQIRYILKSTKTTPKNDDNKKMMPDIKSGTINQEQLKKLLETASSKKIPVDEIEKHYKKKIDELSPKEWADAMNGLGKVKSA